MVKKGNWIARVAIAMASVAGSAWGAADRGRVILVTQEKGLVHQVAERGVVEKVLREMGERGGFEVEVMRDVRLLDRAALKRAKVVVFYVDGEVPFSEFGLQNLDKWVKQGGAILAIHGATDALKTNGVWHNLIGGTYDGRAISAKGAVKVVDGRHPAGKALAAESGIDEVVYQQRGVDPKVVHEVLALDMERSSEKRPVHVPIAWCRHYEKGKTFYTQLGHSAETWGNPAYQAHLMGALNWLMGVETGNGKANPESWAKEDEAARKGGEKGKMIDLPAVEEGLRISVFGGAPRFHSPASMCVSPDGKVFVGEDEYNTSDNRKMGICDVKMLVDTDGDGVADKDTVFAAGLCAPQGMTYVGGTLYVVNAPYLTALRDTDGDGKADEVKTLVTGLGPVPEGLVHHIPSGVCYGMDGFLYISVGDKGIVKATGTDGRTVSLMGGGVVRVRTDGTEMEVFASGNRNIYCMSVDPYLNVFTRDNTNDGGGWNSRLSHIERGGQYGYPTLFTNFGDEVIPCLADYGVGGATGNVYVKEPLLPRPYGDSLYTIDWGRSFVYRHNLAARGATFRPDQEEFVFGKFPTSVNADARGRIFVCNWERLSWGASAPMGSIWVIQAQANKAPAIPDMAKATAGQILVHLEGESALLRREAQVEILRRGDRSIAKSLTAIVDAKGTLDARVAALYTYAQLIGREAMPQLATWWREQALREFAIRAMADRPTLVGYANAELFAASSIDPDPRVQEQAAIAMGKSGRADLAGYFVPMTADEDVMARHAAQQAIRELKAVDAIVAALTETQPADVTEGVLRTARDMHDPRVVAAVRDFIARTSDVTAKKQAIVTLERLYTVEAPWDGSWWLTRPDTRGPNYKPVKWAESTRVGELLVALIRDGNAEVAKAAVAAAGHCRVVEAAGALAELANAGGALKVEAVRALFEIRTATPEVLRTLEAVLTMPGWDEGLVNEAAGVLGGIDAPAARETLVRVMMKLDGDGKVREGVVGKLAESLGGKPVAAEAIGSAPAVLAAKTRSAREAMAAALLRSNDAKAKEVVETAWEGNDEKQVCALLVALTRVSADNAKAQAGRVKGLLKDSRVAVRHAAIAATGNAGDTAAVAELLGIKSMKDREMVAKSLAQLDPGKTDKQQVVPVAKLLSETAPEMAKASDKEGYAKVLAGAQRFLADARVPREQAAEWMKELKQVGVITEYMMTEPIPTQPGKAFVTVLPPEEKAEGPFSSFPAGDKMFSWRQVVVTDPTGKLPLAAPGNSVVFLTASMTVPTGGPAVLNTGSDDGLKVYINGKQVIANDANRPCRPEEDRTVVQLRQGTNTFLFRVNNNAGDSGVQARVRTRVTDFEPAELEPVLKDLPAGDASRGRQVFETLGCVKCHTTDAHEEPKGPYLGGAGSKYSRAHLLESILRPGAKIAQGFGTVKITANAEGGVTADYVGWVGKEAGDEVTLRDPSGQGVTVAKSKIVKRDALPQSMMPDGLMSTSSLEDLAALIGYLESLKGK